MKSKGIVALAVLFALGASGVDAMSSPLQHPPTDHQAVSRTHHPTIRTQAGAGRAATATILVRSSTPSSLGGSPYVVGTTVTPTLTSPELDEAIAIDPTNPFNLVAVVSDFSRVGFNTTKYSVSYNNGAGGTWSENFVPTLGGKLATSDFQDRKSVV